MLSIYIDQVDSHVHLRVFYNHGLCGKLILRTEEFKDFLDDLEIALGRINMEGSTEHVFKCSPEIREKIEKLILED